MFSIQEKIIENILESQRERRALESVPKPLDPIQQTVASVIQAAVDHPGIPRAKAPEAIRFLNQPLPCLRAKDSSFSRCLKTTAVAAIKEEDGPRQVGGAGNSTGQAPRLQGVGLRFTFRFPVPEIRPQKVGPPDPSGEVEPAAEDGGVGEGGK